MSKIKQYKKKKNRAMRIMIIVFLALFIVVLCAVIAAFVILNHYTGKIIHIDEDQTMASGETLEEETEEGGTNSPQDIVASIEDILNQISGNTKPSGDTSSKEDNGESDDETKEPAPTLPEVKPDKNVLNILLVGIDSRANSNAGRSDAMIVMSINKNNKTITLTSFLRDMYVAIPGRGNNRINAAHAYGGGQLLMDTIELNFGIHIDYFARVNFFHFVSIIDAAGGVTVNVDEKERPYVNSYLKEINKLQGLAADDSALQEDQVGNLLLNGRQALAYARIRYVGSDYARTQRQREVLFAVADRMRNMNLLELNSFLNVALPQLATSMDQGTINSLVLDAPSLLGYTINQHRVPADGTATGMRIDGKSVIAVDFAANRILLNQIIYGR